MQEVGGFDDKGNVLPENFGSGTSVCKTADAVAPGWQCAFASTCGRFTLHHVATGIEVQLGAVFDDVWACLTRLGS